VGAATGSAGASVAAGAGCSVGAAGAQETSMAVIITRARPNENKRFILFLLFKSMVELKPENLNNFEVHLRKTGWYLITSLLYKVFV
jgi:hypothetical protein